MDGPVVPKKPFCEIIPTMATIAKRPLLISAFRDRSLATGSHGLDLPPTRKTGKPNLPQPTVSPGRRPSPCLNAKSSRNAMKMPIWAQPSPGTLDKAARPLGTSLNSRFWDGDK